MSRQGFITKSDGRADLSWPWRRTIAKRSAPHLPLKRASSHAHIQVAKSCKESRQEQALMSLPTGLSVYVHAALNELRSVLCNRSSRSPQRAKCMEKAAMAHMRVRWQRRAVTDVALAAAALVRTHINSTHRPCRKRGGALAVCP